MSYLGRHADAAREVAQPFGQPCRVEAAGVDDDLHAGVHREAEALLHLSHERVCVPAVGVLETAHGEDQHGEFGEVVAGQHVNVAAGQHLPGCVEPVTEETRCVGDSEWDGVHRGAGPWQLVVIGPSSSAVGSATARASHGAARKAIMLDWFAGWPNAGSSGGLSSGLRAEPFRAPQPQPRLPTTLQ
jgi:hypothetical protein